MSKQRQTYRCTGCSSKITILSRVNMWPPAVSIPAESLSEWLAQCASNKRALIACMRDLLQNYEEKERYWDYSGEWQPLSVWKSRGYDAARLEAATPAQHIRDDEVHGTVYFVKTLVEGERAKQGTRRVQERRAD